MKVDEAYNLWASVYDTNKNKTRDLELKVSKSILGTKYFANILELGCGTGKNTEWLSKNCNSLLGIDFSEEMLSIAKTKVVRENVKYKYANLLKNWEFVDSRFDLIIASLILEHIDNIGFIFNQAYKTLNEKGLFYICELHPFKQYTGSKASFENEGKVTKLETYTHHISEYLRLANKAGFKLSNLNEWFDETGSNSLPRLVSFLFIKE